MTAVLGAFAFALAPAAQAAPAVDESWAFYGHDTGGQRFSPLSQVNKANVSRLTLAWGRRWRL